MVRLHAKMVLIRRVQTTALNPQAVTIAIEAVLAEAAATAVAIPRQRKRRRVRRWRVRLPSCRA